MLWNSGSVLFDNHLILGKVMTMRRYTLIGLCILCIWLMTGEGVAQESDRATGTGFSFLKLPTNARMTALGEAGVSLIGSGKAILYNPAGLAFMEDREAYFTYVDWIGGLKHYVAGISASVPRIGTLGLSAVNLDFNTTQKFSDYAISVAYGGMITNRISVGTTLKLIHGRSPGEDREQNVFAFDLGAYFATGLRNTVIAMGVENLSSSGLGEPEQWGLPKNVRLGVLLDLIALMDGGPVPHALDLVVDANNPNDSNDGFYTDIGIEYTYIHQTAIDNMLGFSLRVGQRERSGSISDTNTLGIGVLLKTHGIGLKVDYTSKFFRSVFDKRVHILSVAFDF